MNRVAERKEQTLRRDLMFLFGDGASPAWGDRLFQDVEIPIWRSPLRLTVASPLGGTLYLHAFVQDVSEAIRNCLSHSYYHTWQIVAAAHHGQYDWPGSRGLMVADLLEGTRTPCVELGKALLEPGHLRGLANWPDQLGKIASVMWLTERLPWDPSFVLPDSPERQRAALVDFLPLLRSS